MTLKGKKEFTLSSSLTCVIFVQSSTLQRCMLASICSHCKQRGYTHTVSTSSASQVTIHTWIGRSTLNSPYSRQFALFEFQRTFVYNLTVLHSSKITDNKTIRVSPWTSYSLRTFGGPICGLPRIFRVLS